ncbi:fructose-2,6-bisphosphatase, partial [Rhodococcus rhodochrous]
MQTLATVHLVRHGEVHNPDRVLYGRLPEFGLSELGHEMARGVAAWFAERAAQTGR